MADQKTIRVLVAEDDYLVGEMISHSLKELGYEQVGQAADGTEAVTLTMSQRPDVVLMDIRMPEMDGLEAARRIQQQAPTPVVILSAYESQNLVQEAAQSGAFAYLTKPPKRNEIERAIQIAICRFREVAECWHAREELRIQNQNLEGQLAEMEPLRGFVTICSHCKKVRDNEGKWQEIDSFVQQHAHTDFSHGICLACLRKHYPDVAAGSSPR